MKPYDRIEKVIRYIEKHHLEQPQLVTLAKVAGLSEFHFHRLFSHWAGVTPKLFLKFITNEHAKSLLAESRDLLDVSLETGLSGPGRLHDLLISIEGMTPGEYKRKAEGLEIKYAFHETPFGLCLIGVTKRGICHFSFLDSKKKKSELKKLKNRWPKAKFILSTRETSEVLKKIFNRKSKGKISVVLSGTPFQLKVWEALLQIPEGKVLSYGDIASTIGLPKACRAVGTAVGSNPVGYLIPCHRVIRDIGIIGNYGWGPDRKKAMLAWEIANASK